MGDQVGCVGRVAVQKVGGQRADRDAVVDGEFAGPVTADAVDQETDVEEFAVGVDAESALTGVGEGGGTAHARKGEQGQAGAPHRPLFFTITGHPRAHPAYRSLQERSAGR